MKSDNELPEPPALENVPTVDLVREALDGARELVRVEIEMAKSEMQDEVQKAKHAAIVFGAAAATGILVLCSLIVAAVLALGGTPTVALALAAILLALGAGLALAGYAILPKTPLEYARQRLKREVHGWGSRREPQVKEHVA